MATIEVDTKRPCKATLVIGMMIAEPLTNGNWRPVCVDNTSLGVNLDGYNHQQLEAQVKQKIEEFKQLWGNQIISLQDLPNNVEQPQ